jgi:hypothetical protein
MTTSTAIELFRNAIAAYTNNMQKGGTFFIKDPLCKENSIKTSLVNAADNANSECHVFNYRGFDYTLIVMPEQIKLGFFFRRELVDIEYHTLSMYNRITKQFSSSVKEIDTSLNRPRICIPTKNV